MILLAAPYETVTQIWELISGSSYDAKKQIMAYDLEEELMALFSNETDVAPVKVSSPAAAQWNEVNQFWLLLTLTEPLKRPAHMTQTNFSLFMKDYEEGFSRYYELHKQCVSDESVSVNNVQLPVSQHMPAGSADSSPVGKMIFESNLGQILSDIFTNEFPK